MLTYHEGALSGFAAYAATSPRGRRITVSVETSTAMCTSPRLPSSGQHHLDHRSRLHGLPNVRRFSGAGRRTAVYRRPFCASKEALVRHGTHPCPLRSWSRHELHCSPGVSRACALSTTRARRPVPEHVDEHVGFVVLLILCAEEQRHDLPMTFDVADQVEQLPMIRDLPVSYTHLRAHETRHDLVCRLLLEKKKN